MKGDGFRVPHSFSHQAAWVPQPQSLIQEARLFHDVAIIPDVHVYMS